MHALHCITLRYVTLHCIAFHCIALHCIALHYITHSVALETWATDIETILYSLNHTGNIDCDLSLTSQNRRCSLPVAAKWAQAGRRGSLDKSKDLRKLLDKRSNEILQQRQQYRIFENKFKGEAERCSKLEQDTERLKQLMAELLGIHGRYHHSYVFPCSNYTAVFFLVLIAATLIAAFAV